MTSLIRGYGLLITGILALLLGLVVAISPWRGGIFVGLLLIFAGQTESNVEFL
jgi:uncharacterized membrane protein HdeD (DUF308 family)